MKPCWQHNRVNCPDWRCRMRAQDWKVTTCEYRRMIEALARAREKGDRLAIANLETQIKSVIW